ncbi:DUF481 domain-containing protein [Paracoccus contaminans]|uniref:DUF481 domain-containing protein n=1 Tax=Paracoccus contaminans TaxID=1945662 RepID=A0A1W6CUN7_9RHOB|nr:DUF481 domain-containing protein [Paracoccus contaminans]ARJ68519.1 hypothetical protein B0A89_01520 [Paracoccus contaminans]
MKKLALLTSASALAVLLGAPAFAQEEFAVGGGVIGANNINQRITDIRDDVQDDFDRSNDSRRFGPADRKTGLAGSVAMSYTGRTGNSENQDFSLAGSLSHSVGQFQQSVGIVLEYGEDNDGDTNTEKTSVIYDANYYFNDKFYAFALGRLATDGMAGDIDGLADDETFADLDGGLKRDAFFGVGPGYRIINNDTTAWRMQAGVGIRYTKQFVVDATDAVDPLMGSGHWDSNTGTGYIVSSRFYHKFNDQFFLTNYTDWLSSEDSPDTATNELGLNFKMSDAFATRVSYKTEYVEDRDKRTDNTLGVSLVYGF